MDNAAGLRAHFSEMELEVLRLLAGGHTVKSIAARLGRSEAAINERLRDARRKAGIGSSRELARLLAAQKIWDEKIDLAENGEDGDEPGQPRDAGRRRPKGMIAMMLALPLAAAGALLLASGETTDRVETVAEARPSPLVGTWSLDVARIPADERPQRVTIAFRIVPGGKWATRVEMVAPDGTASYAESVAAPDGELVPVTGTMGFIDSASIRHPAPGTLVLTLAKQGAPVSTRVYAAAKDARTMTETIVWPGEGVPKLETTYFNRVN